LHIPAEAHIQAALSLGEQHSFRTCFRHSQQGMEAPAGVCFHKVTIIFQKWIFRRNILRQLFVILQAEDECFGNFQNARHILHCIIAQALHGLCVFRKRSIYFFFQRCSTSFLMIGGLGFSPKACVDIHALCLPFQSSSGKRKKPKHLNALTFSSAFLNFLLLLKQNAHIIDPAIQNTNNRYGFLPHSIKNDILSRYQISQIGFTSHFFSQCCTHVRLSF